MRAIDIDALLTNYYEMINTLEYDSMRSAGKAKLNADKLVSLYELVERYEVLKNSKKATPKKEVANG
tara:strand:- start:2758 stop:2958 length:201 start_codon:yes stop_codon:yes gene_type:complete